MKAAAHRLQWLSRHSRDGVLPEAVANYKLRLINWGDGTSQTLGTITFNSATQSFTVSGSHVYGTAGNYTATTTISHGNAPTATANTPVTVNVRSVIVTPAAAIAAIEGSPTGTVIVATFQDPGVPETTSHYPASIDWGDGTVTERILGFNLPRHKRRDFTVSGTHTYRTAGTYNITTTVSHDTAIPASTTTQANVSPAPVDLTMVPINPAEGTAFNGTLANFIDSNPFAVAGDFNASINWGDGSPASTGTIVADASTPGRFNLIGNHVFADGPAVFNVSVSLNDNSVVGRPVAAGAEAIGVTNAAPTPTIQGPGFRFGGTTVFSIGAADPSGADSAAGFQYSINWGDGSSIQTIARTPGNGPPQNVAHTYSTGDPFTITVTATDKDGGVGTATFATVGLQTAGSATPPVLQNLAIDGGSTARSQINSINFQIVAPTPVSTLSVSNLTLIRNGNVHVSLAGVQFSFDPVTKQVSLNTSKLNLADGQYQLQVHLGSAGTLPINFTKLRGDLNGDGIVNNADVNIEKNHRGATNLNFDLNGDRRVNAADVAIAKAAIGQRTASFVKPVALTAGTGISKPAINFNTIKLAQNAAPDRHRAAKFECEPVQRTRRGHQADRKEPRTV